MAIFISDDQIWVSVQSQVSLFIFHQHGLELPVTFFKNIIISLRLTSIQGHRPRRWLCCSFLWFYCLLALGADSSWVEKKALRDKKYSLQVFFIIIITLKGLWMRVVSKLSFHFFRTHCHQFTKLALWSKMKWEWSKVPCLILWPFLTCFTI